MDFSIINHFNLVGNFVFTSSNLVISIILHRLAYSPWCERGQPAMVGVLKNCLQVLHAHILLVALMLLH